MRHMRRNAATVFACIGLAASAAVAQPTLQFGLRNLSTQVLGSDGSPAAFGGVTHTGSVIFTSSPNSAFVDTFLLGNGFGGGVTATYPALGPAIVNVRVDMTAGRVTGGSVSMATSLAVAGDVYVAAVSANPTVAGVIVNGGGGFGIQFATTNGQLTDTLYGNVPVIDWFQGQGGDAIRGAGIVFRFDPVGSSSDMDVYLIRPERCYSNCDGSTTTPVLGASDFSCFLDRFRLGQSYANCDGSTVLPTLGASDFSCFLDKFRRGCV